jgi:hypothetical protein
MFSRLLEFVATHGELLDRLHEEGPVLGLPTSGNAHGESALYVV